MAPGSHEHRQKYRRSIKVLCSLLGFSRQSYYQGNKALEEEVFNAELIVQEVIKHRQIQPKVGSRKLYLHLEPYMQAHKIAMGRDALFNLLAAHKLLIRKRKRNKPVTTSPATGCINTLTSSLVLSRVKRIRFW